MPEWSRIPVVLTVIGLLFALSRAFVPAAPGDEPPPPIDPAAVRAQVMQWDPAVDPATRKLVDDAIHAARPEAQRLVDVVDGLVKMRVGPTGEQSVGLTESRGNADFTVTLDLDAVYSGHGHRGIQRLVLHEFGHVVDHALLDDGSRAQLDASVPRGYGCEPGEPTGACASRSERFAETFAKWAMNDIGADIYLGYKVPPPAMPLPDWARPLVALGR
jgi:hypothetical protein